MRDALRRDVLDETLLTPGSPWAGVRVLDVTDSTNAEAGRAGEPWVPVLADHQEGGRGRLGRSWVDVPRASLAVSVLLPAPPAGRTGWLPLLAGLAVHRAVADVAGVHTVLKWPNDVLVPADGGRKVCGVLCEMTPAGVVVGAGVNVDQARDELPVEAATSLALAGSGPVGRERLAAAYLTHLAALHAALTGDAGAAADARDAYRAVCATVGADVELHGQDPGRRGTVRTRALGVDDEGRLVVRSGTGSASVAAGDVTHVRASPPR